MTYLQKNAVVSFFTILSIYTVYAFVMLPRYAAGRYDSPEALSDIGIAVLVILGATIVVQIVGSIVFNIIHAIITNDPSPTYVVDERDKAIELKGVQVSFYVAGGGVMLAMIALALGVHLFWVFNLILFGFAIGDLVGSTLMLTLYQRDA